MTKLLKHDVFALLIIFMVTLFVRFPYFFPSVINWDESTFILAGQAIANGGMPYVDFFDVKPPFAGYDSRN